MTKAFSKVSISTTRKIHNSSRVEKKGKKTGMKTALKHYVTSTWLSIEHTLLA
jgi:hypothetical protein